MNKKRQHYVWQHYLKAWMINGQVFCLRNHKNIFQAKTTMLAVQNYFYKINELTEQDLRTINLLIEPMPNGTKKIAKDWIKHSKMLFSLKNIADIINIVSVRALILNSSRICA